MKIQTVLTTLALTVISVVTSAPKSDAFTTKTFKDHSYVCAESSWTIWNTDGSNSGKKLFKGECMEVYAADYAAYGYKTFGRENYLTVKSANGSVKLLRLTNQEFRKLEKAGKFNGC
jgi:hypothetical protein